MNNALKNLTLLFSLLPAWGVCRLLDRVEAVVDQKVITQSEVARVYESLERRRQVSPNIFHAGIQGPQDVIQLLINRDLIRKGLKEIGYEISDGQVESQISKRQQMLGLERQELIKSLENFAISFEEYFSLIRASMEYAFFRQRIINPLISVTDQEIKNAFFQKYASSKTISFKYRLVSFSLTAEQFSKSGVSLEEMPTLLSRFRETGVLKESMAKVETNDLGEIIEDDLSSKIQQAVATVKEGHFSRPVKMGGRIFVFFVEEKDVVQSEFFQQQKPELAAQIKEREARKVEETWLKNKRREHFVKVIEK